MKRSSSFRIAVLIWSSVGGSGTVGLSLDPYMSNSEPNSVSAMEMNGPTSGISAVMEAAMPITADALCPGSPDWNALSVLSLTADLRPATSMLEPTLTSSSASSASSSSFLSPDSLATSL